MSVKCRPFFFLLSTFFVEECRAKENILWAVLKANALNTPPGEYGRKIKTQRNWRGLAQAVEHVV